uniref:Uncharacterized protein n=1 Tax=Peronospora matthiolae TaxID=2874970 RepID=A0AAV1VCL9_9STRA
MCDVNLRSLSGEGASAPRFGESRYPVVRKCKGTNDCEAFLPFNIRLMWDARSEVVGTRAEAPRATRPVV